MKKIDNKANPDVIVIGSGPGGATVARDLSRFGKKVLILEWSKASSIEGTLAQCIREILIPGKSLLLTPDRVAVLRGITTGGSSVFYYGTSFPVPFEVFERYGINLRVAAQEAVDELPIAPLKDAMMTPMANRIMASAQELGLEWKKLDKFMYQEKWRPGFKFGLYGDPNGVKWNARMSVECAVDNGATLLNEARVEKIIVENEKAIGVQYIWHGEKHAVFAPKIVLAAGGIGSPLILRASGIKEAGYDFFIDPLIFVCGTMQGVRNQENEIPMSAGVLVEDEGYMMSDVTLSRSTHFVLSALALKFHKLFAFNSTARIMIKIKDEMGGYITDRGGIRKSLSAQDKEKLQKGYESARRILTKAGSKDIYKTVCFAAHPGGTVKLSHLVDSNLKTQYDNLYVCDCSVIPEAWGLPPTLTIIALGKRLARHFVGL